VCERFNKENFCNLFLCVNTARHARSRAEHTGVVAWGDLTLLRNYLGLLDYRLSIFPQIKTLNGGWVSGKEKIFVKFLTMSGQNTPETHFRFQKTEILYP
jgi:hypothetical protein